MVTGRTTEQRMQQITTTNNSASVTGAAGTFNRGDQGRPIAGTGIPAGTVLATVTSDTAATLSAAATAAGTVAAVIGLPGQTVQDAARMGWAGWQPESQTEADSYSVAANNAGVIDPARIMDTTTSVSSKQRTRG